MTVLFGPHGETGVFDEHRQQVPALQKSWVLVFAEFLRSQGIDVTTCTFEIGSLTVVVYEQTDGNLNYMVLQKL